MGKNSQKQNRQKNHLSGRITKTQEQKNMVFLSCFLVCSFFASSRPNSYQGLGCPAKDWAVHLVLFMDGHLSPAMVGTRWSGLLRGGNQCSDAGPGSALALAHGQMVSHYMQVEPETTIMIYDAKISWDGGAVLKVFGMMKPEGKAPLQHLHLEDVKTTTILAMSEDQQMIHTAEELHVRPGDTCDVDGVSVEVRHVDGPVLQLSHEFLFKDPSTFTARSHFATPNAIIGKLEEFWRGQWWRQSLPSHSDWERMFAFAKQYLPRKVMQCSPISPDRWTEVKKRYGPRSARGPDSMDRRNLQWLLPGLQDSLVNLLNHCERLEQWPTALLPGFVYPLPKRLDGTSS